MTIVRDSLSKSETVTVAAAEGGVPQLVEARRIIAAFQANIRKKALTDFELWLARARPSLVASFANGVIKDQAAVSPAITSSWPNGSTEGQITKLKLVKRQMYGRESSTFSRLASSAPNRRPPPKLRQSPTSVPIDS